MNTQVNEKKRSEKTSGLLRFLLTVAPLVTEVTDVSYTGVTDKT